MMRRFLVVAAIAVLLASCGSASTIETTSTFNATTSPGKRAPDFTLALSDGTDFTLSGETRPVYMVFWAEW